MMSRLIRYILPIVVFFILLVFHSNNPVYAGNINPLNDGSQYAWGENVGWINFNPTTGPGVTVTDTDVTGFAWSENLGWINLNPINGGVINDGNGNLSGSAWAENGGWVNFAPTGAGVTIDISGLFHGKAWGENIGWISFESAGAVPFSLSTSWKAPDITPPTLIGMPLGITVDAVSGGSARVDYTAPTATDDVDPSPIVRCTPDPKRRSVFLIGTTTVTCTATDSSGNSSSGSFLVTVLDPPPTLIGMPQDITVETLYASGVSVAFTMPTSTDNLDPLPVVGCAPTSGSSFAVGSTTVTCTATDSAGNSGSGTFLVTVLDVVPVTFDPPTFSGVPTIISVLTDKIDIIDFEGIGASQPYLLNQIPGLTFQPLQSKVISPATIGNSPGIPLSAATSGTTAIHGFGSRIDFLYPASAVSVFVAPSFIALNVGAPPIPLYLTAYDASGSEIGQASVPVLRATNNIADIQNFQPLFLEFQSTGTPISAVTIDWNIPFNSSGNALFFDDLTYSTSTNTASAFVTYALPIATDTTDPAPIVNCLPASGGIFAIGTTTVTCTAIDSAGNATTESFLLTVNADNTYTMYDTIPPVITAPVDLALTVPNGTLVPLSDFGIATATDRWDGNLTPIADQAGPFLPGRYEVVWSATDSSGNTASAVQSVIINSPSAQHGIPAPSGGVVDLVVPPGQIVQNVSMSPSTPTAPGVDFINVQPGSPNPFNSLGTLSYEVVVPAPGDSATTTITLDAVLPPDIFSFTVPFKVFNDGSAIPIPQVGTDAQWTSTVDTATNTTTFEITIVDGGAFDLDALVNGIVVDPIAFGRIFNFPPTADGGVDRSFECVTESCAVTLSAVASTDPDSTDVVSDIVDYLWYEDYVEGAVNTQIAMGEIVNLNLTLGDHLITLVVKDSVGNISKDTFTVSINPAALSLLEVTKAEVEWDESKSKLKLSGKIALPVGRTPYDVDAVGSAFMDIPGLGEIVSGSAAFTVEGSDSMKWEYEEDSATTGLSEFKIDWKGAKFDYEQNGLHLKTSHMGQASSSLEIERNSITEALTISVAGVSIDVDATGMATSTSPGISIDVDDDGEIEVDLPFAVLPNMTITIAGAVTDSIQVGKYYTAAVGKFKVKGNFDQAGVDVSTLVPELNLKVFLGAEGFSGSFMINTPEWKEVKPSEWKYERDM